MGALVSRVLERWGSFLVMPQSTVASLPPQDGRHDGFWIGLLYVMGSQLISVGQSIKSVLVIGNLSAVATLGAQLGRILLPPILLLLLIEFMVGPKRSYRSGLFLLPLVVCATAANLMRQMGHPVQSELMPLLLGGVWAMVLVFVSRKEIPYLEDEAAEAEA